MSQSLTDGAMSAEVDRVAAEVVAEITDRLHAGAPVDVEKYIARHPELADRLRRLLPALQVLDHFSSPADGAGLTSRTADDEVLTGTLGDYRLIREVGRGGMAVVYEAEQVSLGRRVALKVLPFASTMDARQLQRFHNEARAAAGLHHINIVPVYGVGCERGVHYYAMQFIDGRTLAEVIAQQQGAPPSPVPTTGPTEPQAAASSAPTVPPAAQATSAAPRDAAYFRRAAEWGMQAAEALDCAHALSVVHRDVKPANLLVDAAGRLWVTDFGLAQVPSDARLTMTGDLVGTLRYMSPEQALAKRRVIDHRTDVYSLGATLYELLTLQPAFGGSDRQELLRQIAFEEPRRPRRINPAIPDELETIVLKAMEKNPEERYATAQQLADDLRRFLEDQPIQARRPSLLRRARKWARRHRAAVAEAASVLLLTFTILAASAGWLARDYEVRCTETQRAVTAALDESTAWQEQRRLPEALSAARRAVGLADSGTADDALRSRARQRLADLELLERLENIRLERMTEVTDGRFDWQGTDVAFGRTFREAGLDVESLPAEEAAERIRQSTVAVELAAVLAFWALLRRNLRGENDPSWKGLLRVARLADDDAWRTRLRAAVEKIDWAVLRELAASKEIFGLPGATLDSLGRILAHDKDARGPAEVFLREAQRRHPNDFWLNENLALFFIKMQPPQPEEAVRFATVAVALRPGSPGAHNTLGGALHDIGRLNDAIAAFKQAIALDPKYAMAHHNLGYALTAKDRLDEAIAAYQQAIANDPKFVSAHYNLGNALVSKDRVDEAVVAYQKAVALNPKHAWAHNSLGNALAAKKRWDEAIAAYQQAIASDPKFASAYYHLGNAHAANGRVDEAILPYQKAVALNPKHDLAHNNLGNALAAKARVDYAIKEFKLAIALDPTFATAHNNLGSALNGKGQVDEAIAAYQQAIDIDPEFATAYYNLGNALARQGRLDEAIAAYQAVVALDPKHALAHFYLGKALGGKHRLDEAIVAYQEAVALDPKHADTHYNLGNALKKKDRLDEAVTHYQEAISLKEDFAEAYCNLGLVLRDQGRFADALVQLRRGDQLGSKNPNWQYPSKEWVKNCESLITLDGKLQAVLSGQMHPADTADRLDLAEFCQRPCKKHYAAAQRFYSEAFAAEQKLAENLNAQHRYKAACAAARAGCGQGADADTLDEKERARLRQQALDWLRADLKVYRRAMDQAPDKYRGVVAQRMLYWLQDNAFAGVRGADALARLPEVERHEWQELWQEVESLRQRAAQRRAAGSTDRP
jgi:tetratricopeptide (TPR) repeat protein